mgnify:FL=1
MNEKQINSLLRKYSGDFGQHFLGYSDNSCIIEGIELSKCGSAIMVSHDDFSEITLDEKFMSWYSLY